MSVELDTTRTQVEIILVALASDIAQQARQQ
jgi:hypothetical protein